MNRTKLPTKNGEQRIKSNFPIFSCIDFSRGIGLLFCPLLSAAGQKKTQTKTDTNKAIPYQLSPPVNLQWLIKIKVTGNRNSASF